MVRSMPGGHSSEAPPVVPEPPPPPLPPTPPLEAVLPPSPIVVDAASLLVIGPADVEETGLGFELVAPLIDAPLVGALLVVPLVAVVAALVVPLLVEEIALVVVSPVLASVLVTSLISCGDGPDAPSLEQAGSRQSIARGSDNGTDVDMGCP